MLKYHCDGCDEVIGTDKDPKPGQTDFMVEVGPSSGSKRLVSLVIGDAQQKYCPTCVREVVERILDVLRSWETPPHAPPSR
jgi:hypothetical protein